MTLTNRFSAQRRFALAMVVVPTVGAVAAVGLALHDGGVSAVALWVFVSLYFASVVGVEIGFHRYFSTGRSNAGGC